LLQLFGLYLFEKVDKSFPVFSVSLVLRSEQELEKLMEENVEGLAVAQNAIRSQCIDEVSYSKLLRLTRLMMQKWQLLCGILGSNGY
jgi:hypothetical protein